jgi:hypothetical protein
MPLFSRADLLDGLLGYWPFNGDGADLSGGGYNFDLHGGSPLRFSDGLYGQALDLHHDGTQFAQRPGDDPAFNFEGSDVTIQIWVNFNTTEDEQTLFEKFYGGGGPGWTLTKQPCNIWHFWADPSARLYSDPQHIPLGVWHQVVVRKTGSLFELFYDAVLVASDVNDTPIPDTDFPLLVGKRNDADGRDFSVDGRLDEAAIWGRALTNDELATLWNNGKGMPLF